VIVEPFRSYHIDLLRAQGVQGAQLAEISLVPFACASLAPPRGPAVTVFDRDRIVLCGGIVVQAPGRGECWALMADGTSKHMTWLHFAVKRFLSMQRWQRLEATVEESFGQGCRWVELLGFQFEGKMLKYGLNGETHLRYART
jgi:hypothetical protein